MRNSGLTLFSISPFFVFDFSLSAFPFTCDGVQRYRMALSSHNSLKNGDQEYTFRFRLLTDSPETQLENETIHLAIEGDLIR